MSKYIDILNPNKANAQTRPGLMIHLKITNKTCCYKTVVFMLKTSENLEGMILRNITLKTHVRASRNSFGNWTGVLNKLACANPSF